jgi:hypothetical protein
MAMQVLTKWKPVASATGDLASDLADGDTLEIVEDSGKIKIKRIPSGQTLAVPWGTVNEVVITGKHDGTKGSGRNFKIVWKPPVAPATKWTHAGTLFALGTTPRSKAPKDKDHPIGGDGNWTAQEGG